MSQQYGILYVKNFFKGLFTSNHNFFKGLFASDCNFFKGLFDKLLIYNDYFSQYKMGFKIVFFMS